MSRAQLSSSEDIRPAFRHDINALRAVAIISVVFYHFELFGFNGGFVGVDIFFVISGFLMANIICQNISDRKFDVIEFYMSRSRRIIPALLAMTISTLSLGWFILLPSDYKELGGHARDTLLFISNIRYLNEAGYFDDASKSKWLLQTWSLSIEWQFYLLYPLILTALKKYNLEKRNYFTHTFGCDYCVANLLPISIKQQQRKIFLHTPIKSMGIAGRRSCFPVQ